MSAITKIAEIELVRKLKPPVNNADIMKWISEFPEDQRYAASTFVIGQLTATCNMISQNSPDTAQVLQIDGLANYLESNPSFLEGFTLHPENRKIQYRGKELNEDVYGLDISPIDILSKKLSEAFNYRYTFQYKFLLTALKKALKMQNFLPTIENIEYVEKIVSSILSGTAKSRVTVSEILKQSQGLDKKFVAIALVKLGWERKTYKSKNVVYLKPKQ
jgi:hypothetical protein